jgi:hypothetical protein
MKPKATNCSNHRTISPVTHTTEPLTRTLKRRTESKIVKYLKKITLDLEEEKELEMQMEC